MRKKLFAILMSAMMMVTFMPAMAFAGTTYPNYSVKENTVKWAADFQSATVKLQVQETETSEVVDEDTYTADKIVYTFNADGDGMVTAKATWDFGTVGSYTSQVKFYDINGAKITTNINSADADDILDALERAKEQKVDAFPVEQVNEITKITLVEPAYCMAAGQTKPNEHVRNISHNTGSDAILNYALMVGTATYDKYEDATVALPVTVATDAQVKTWASASKWTDAKTLAALLAKKNVAGIIGSTSYNLKVVNKATYEHVVLGVSDATMVDSTTGKNVPLQKTLVAGGDNEMPAFTYDGKEHTVATTAMKNVVVKYAAWTKDATTKQWVAPKTADFSETAPVVKNAGSYKYTVQVSTGKKFAKTVSFDVVVTVLQKEALLEFVQNMMVVEYGVVTTPADVLTLKGVCADDAALANAELAKATVTGFFTQVGNSELVIGKETLDSIDKINKEKLGNYHITVNEIKDDMTLVIEKADNDCGVKLNSKTVKASALKKAAKKYDVKAYADFGTAKVAKVSGSSKLTISGGQLKVKKGTKKGTYKIKVKVTVAGTANYAAAKDFETIVVKVK